MATFGNHPEKQFPSIPHIMNSKVAFSCALVACCAASFMAGRIRWEPFSQSSHLPPSSLRPNDESHSGFNQRRGPSTGEMRSASRLLAQQTNGTYSASTKQGRIALLEFTTINRIPLDRTKGWLDLVRSLNASEIEGLVIHMEARSVNYLNKAQYDMLLIAWAGLEPVLALEHFIEKDISDETTRQSMLAMWATRDPMAAMEWVKGKSKKHYINSWVPSLISGVAGKDMELATKMVSAMPDSYDRSNALHTLRQCRMKQGLEASRK